MRTEQPLGARAVCVTASVDTLERLAHLTRLTLAVDPTPWHTSLTLTDVVERAVGVLFAG